MTAIVPVSIESQPFYPSADGQPVAETYDHFYALLTTLEVLKQYLADRQATNGIGKSISLLCIGLSQVAGCPRCDGNF